MNNMTTTENDIRPGDTLRLGVGEFPVINAQRVDDSGAHIVLVHRSYDDSFVTWWARFDRQTGMHDAFWGRYDLDFARGAQDFLNRCAEAGVKVSR